MRPGWEGFQHRGVLWTSDLKTLGLKEFHMAERERETGAQSSGGSREATAVSWMGQSKCLLGKQAQIVTVHEETRDLRRWLNLISCWLSCFYYIYPVLSPSGLSPWTSLRCFLHLWLSLDLTNESNLPGRGRTESLHLSPHYLWLVQWLCVSASTPVLIQRPSIPKATDFPGFWWYQSLPFSLQGWSLLATVAC